MKHVPQKYLKTHKLTLPYQEGEFWAKVTKILRDASDLPISVTHENPHLDSNI